MSPGFRSRVSGFGFQVSGYGFQVSGFRFQVSGFGFRVSGFRFRVSGFGFRVSGCGIQVRAQKSRFRVSQTGSESIFQVGFFQVQVLGFGQVCCPKCTTIVGGSD